MKAKSIICPNCDKRIPANATMCAFCQTRIGEPPKDIITLFRVLIFVAILFGGTLAYISEKNKQQVQENFWRQEHGEEYVRDARIGGESMASQIEWDKHKRARGY